MAFGTRTPSSEQSRWNCHLSLSVSNEVLSGIGYEFAPRRSKVKRTIRFAESSTGIKNIFELDLPSCSIVRTKSVLLRSSSDRSFTKYSRHLIECRRNAISRGPTRKYGNSSGSESTTAAAIDGVSPTTTMVRLHPGENSPGGCGRRCVLKIASPSVIMSHIGTGLNRNRRHYGVLLPAYAHPQRAVALHPFPARRIASFADPSRSQFDGACTGQSRT